MTNKLLLTILLFVTGTAAFAQKSKSKGDEPDNKNMEKYLDDGRIGNVNNLIRFRAGMAIANHVGLTYERRFGKRFGLEGGAFARVGKGALWDEVRETIYVLDGSEYSMSKGSAFMIFPKYYRIGKYMNYGAYWGLKYINKMYTTNYIHSYTNKKESAKTSSQFYILSFGSHKQIGSRFTIGTEWGFGYVRDTYKNVPNYSYDTNTSTYVNLGSKTIHSPTVFYNFDISLGFLF